ncbi:DoxX family protein [Kitasatospora sp. NPDC004289]
MTTTSPTPPVTADAPGVTTLPAYDLGLLVLRLGLGLTMAGHGLQKLFGWFGGSGLDATSQFFASVGYPAPDAMAVVAALTETLGGLGVALGLLTPLAGAAVVGTMLNALAVTWTGSFFSPDGPEYVIMLLAAFTALTLTGPGRYSADSFVPVLNRHRLVYGLAALALAVITAGVVLLVRD